MNSKKGFTLIELLVVIAIIAILAAILFPVFAQAREKARSSSCLSNTKQFGTASQLYCDDYDETYAPSFIPDQLVTIDVMTTEYAGYPCRKYYPSDYTTSGGTYLKTKRWTWMDSLFPYVKNLSMYECPSNKNVAGYGMNAEFKTNFKELTTTGNPSYITDANFATYGTLSATQIKNPSQLVLFGDTVIYDDKTSQTLDNKDTYKFVNSLAPFCFNNHFMTSKGSNHAKSERALARRHLTGTNFTFADGHAKYYKYKQGPTEGIREVDGDQYDWMFTSPYWYYGAQ